MESRTKFVHEPLMETYWIPELLKVFFLQDKFFHEPRRTMFWTPECLAEDNIFNMCFLVIFNACVLLLVACCCVHSYTNQNNEGIWSTITMCETLSKAFYPTRSCTIHIIF